MKLKNKNLTKRLQLILVSVLLSIMPLFSFGQFIPLSMLNETWAQYATERFQNLGKTFLGVLELAPICPLTKVCYCGVMFFPNSGDSGTFVCENNVNTSGKYQIGMNSFGNLTMIFNSHTPELPATYTFNGNFVKLHILPSVKWNSLGSNSTITFFFNM